MPEYLVTVARLTHDFIDITARDAEEAARIVLSRYRESDEASVDDITEV